MAFENGMTEEVEVSPSLAPLGSALIGPCNRDCLVKMLPIFGKTQAARAVIAHLDFVWGLVLQYRKRSQQRQFISGERMEVLL